MIGKKWTFIFDLRKPSCCSYCNFRVQWLVLENALGTYWRHLIRTSAHLIVLAVRYVDDERTRQKFENVAAFGVAEVVEVPASGDLRADSVAVEEGSHRRQRLWRRIDSTEWSTGVIFGCAGAARLHVTHRAAGIRGWRRPHSRDVGKRHKWRRGHLDFYVIVSYDTV